jgi:hypothetical protein
MISIAITLEAFEAIRAAWPHSDGPPSKGVILRGPVWRLRAAILCGNYLRTPVVSQRFSACQSLATRAAPVALKVGSGSPIKGVGSRR